MTITNDSLLIKKINTCLTNKYFLLFLIILMGLILRLINLGAEPYWFDEILSLDIVKHYSGNFSGMIEYLRVVEIHPPLYYIWLYGWTMLFGFGEFGVRFLSVLFGLGVIYLGYYFVSVVFKKDTMALLAAFLLAVLPIQIEFSQEARPYIIMCFFGLLAALSFWQYRQTFRRRYLFAYILSALVGLYLHYSFIFIIVALTGFWLIDIFAFLPKNKIKQNIIDWSTVQVIIFIGFYWQLLALGYKILLGRHLIFNMPQMPNGFRDYIFFESMLQQLIWLSKNQSILHLEVFAILLFKITLAILIGYVLLKYKEKIKNKILSIAGQPYIFTIWLMVVPIVFFLFSPYAVHYSTIIARHVILSSVFIVILLAALLSLLDLKKRLLLLALFLTSIMNSTTLIIGNDSLWDMRHRLGEIAQGINVSYQPGDLVIVQGAPSRTDLNHYLREDISAQALHPLNVFSNYDFLASRSTLGLMENEFQFRIDYFKKVRTKEALYLKMNYLVKQYNANRIWLVLSKPDPVLHQWFDQNNWYKAMGSFMPVELYRQQ